MTTGKICFRGSATFADRQPLPYSSANLFPDRPDEGIFPKW